jgi:hypothetical protein
MAGKAKARGKKKSARIAKPCARDAQTSRQSAGDDRRSRSRSSGTSREIASPARRSPQASEATLQGIGRLVETTVAQTRSISEQITEELEKLDDRARTRMTATLKD